MCRISRTLVPLVTTVALTVTCLGVAGCDVLGTAVSAVSSINPCGTILNCDPAQYEFIMSGIDGPGANPDIDPFCVYPPFCSVDQDPIFGGLSLLGP